MLKKIDHIGVAVRNIDEALPFYTETLGLKLKGMEEVPDQKLRVAFLEIGESKIELLESTNPESSISKFIEKNGPGIQHVAYSVDDIVKALEAMKAQGVRLIDEEPRLGAGGSQIAFLHPKSCGGVLTEFCQH